MKTPFLLALTATAFIASAAQAQNDSQRAWVLYNEKKYAESADAFEKLLKTQPPHARLLYQAVLSNYSANRRGRARQLCQYIITNFGTTREAQFCKKLFPEPASTAKSEPEKKPEEKPKEDDKKVAQKKKTDDNDEDEEDDEEKEKATAKFTVDKNARKGTLAFTPQQIAKDGASGIDQTINPNCWFEASVSALAELPRGQRLLASMIKIDSDDTYLVRFPGDGVEYKITELDLKRVGVKDKALWAALIQCAQVKKFPDNDGASDISIGMNCITGCQSQSIDPGKVSLQEISSFIKGAVSSKNPIVCASRPDYETGELPDLIVNSHVYTIIGFDPASGMIVMRNPHGKYSDKFSLEGDPNHRKFEWIGKGVFKMHISLFQKFFDEVCRSFI